tara:strand:+ start:1814 stop:2032 length:219 start_codon:yes stop_codon:yes gene_type:complete
MTEARIKSEIKRLELQRLESSALHDNAVAKLNGLKELMVVYRTLRRCKWYEWTKRRTLEAYADIVLETYNLK